MVEVEGGMPMLRASCRVATAAADVLFSSTLWSTRRAFQGCMDSALLDTNDDFDDDEVKNTKLRKMFFFSVFLFNYCLSFSERLLFRGCTPFLSSRSNFFSNHFHAPADIHLLFLFLFISLSILGQGGLGVGRSSRRGR